MLARLGRFGFLVPLSLAAPASAPLPTPASEPSIECVLRIEEASDRRIPEFPTLQDVALDLIVQNACDRPVAIVTETEDSREALIPLLFELKLTTGDGTPVTLPRWEYRLTCARHMYPTGPFMPLWREELPSGGARKTAIRLADWYGWKNVVVPPGTYRLEATYRGRPSDPGLLGVDNEGATDGTWQGQAASKPVSFRLTARPGKVEWGEGDRGLRAALEPTSPQATLTFCESICPVFRVQNVGAGVIHFDREQPLQGEDEIWIHDARRRDTRTWWNFGFGAIPTIRTWLEPGEQIRIPAPSIRLEAPRLTSEGIPISERGEAVRAALDWLLAHQSSDGRWDADGFDARCRKEPRCGGPGRAYYDPGVTGLALLCFLAAGYTPRDGPAPIRAGVKKALDHLRMLQDQDGCFSDRSGPRFPYNHACATLAMTEAYGLTEHPLWGDSAQRAIRFLESCRNPSFAWRYDVRPGDNDTSVSAWAVMALRSAVISRLEVDDGALRGALAWLDRVTDGETGRAGYTERGSPVAREAGLSDRFPAEKVESSTAMAIVTRIFAGHRAENDPMIERGSRLLLERPPKWDEAGGVVDFCYWYFGTLAMFQIGGDAWQRWDDAVLSAILPHQRLDRTEETYGSWDPVDAWSLSGGRIYATALNCLTLLISERQAQFSGRPAATLPPSTSIQALSGAVELRFVLDFRRRAPLPGEERRPRILPDVATAPESVPWSGRLECGPCVVHLGER